MKASILNRTWLSPVVTLAFGVIAVTGVLLFFHVHNGVISRLHDWFGWAFVVSGLLHLLLNWRPLLSYLKRPSAIVAMVAGMGFLAWLAFAGSAKQQSHGGGGGRPGSAVVSALDANGDGLLDSNEIAHASAALLKLDRNGDGRLTADELQPRRGNQPNRPEGTGAHGQEH